MSEFDPYHKWLGIPRAEQPANHYRLLGITLFESDHEVIEAAADRQMKYVSQCATGEHLKLSQQLMNELSAARVCLLVPAKKSVYDAKLKATLDESQRIEDSMVPVVLSEPDPPAATPVLDFPEPRRNQRPRPKKRAAKQSDSRRKPSKSTRSMGLVAACVAGFLICALGLWSLTRGGQNSQKIDVAAEGPVVSIPSVSVNEIADPPISKPSNGEPVAVPTHDKPRVSEVRPNAPVQHPVRPRRPVPELSLLEQAENDIAARFKNAIDAAKTADSRVGFANDLIKRSEATDDDAARFVMLADAMNQAASAGNIDLALAVVRILSDQFEIDLLQWKEKAVVTLGTASEPLSSEDATQLLQKLVELSEEAATAERYSVSENVMKAAAARFRAPEHESLRTDATFLAAHFHQLGIAFSEAKKARDELEKNSEDPAANLAWGRFVCFYQSDTETGLGLMAKGNDPTWAPLARQQRDRPTNAEDLLALGDAWLKAGANEAETIQVITAGFADDAWQQALNQAISTGTRGIEQKVDQRIIKLFGDTFARTKGDKNGATVEGSAPFWPGDLFTIEFWVSTTADKGTLLSKRHIDRESSMLTHLDRGVPNLSFAIGSGERGSGGGAAINDGKWHHIAIVKRMTDVSLFVDGQRTLQSQESTILDSPSPWKYGTSQGRPSIIARFGGIRISKTARYDESFAPKKRFMKDQNTLLQ